MVKTQEPRSPERMLGRQMSLLFISCGSFALIHGEPLLVPVVVVACVQKGIQSLVFKRLFISPA